MRAFTAVGLKKPSRKAEQRRRRRRAADRLSRMRVVIALLVSIRGRFNGQLVEKALVKHGMGFGGVEALISGCLQGVNAKKGRHQSANLQNVL